MKVKSLCAALGLFAACASMSAGAAKAPASAAAKAASAATAPAKAVKAAPAAKAVAPAAAPGQVWVNTDSKIYHCQGSHHFGKTKQGEYMSQADAQAKGFKPAAGKDCAK